MDMGEPVKIVEVANTLIALSGRRDVDIIFTGLRPGEKLSEELFTPGEDIKSSDHPLVTHVDVPRIAPGMVREKTFVSPDASAVWMRDETV